MREEQRRNPRPVYEKIRQLRTARDVMRKADGNPVSL